MAITNIEDLRQRARGRLPRMVFAYIEGGAYEEATLRRNRHDLEMLAVRQRVMVDVSQRSLSTTILGEPARMPAALAPVGLAGMAYPNGEVHAIKAAQAWGAPACVSTLTVLSVEDIAQAVDKPFWFQLYTFRDRGFTRSMIERAEAAKCPVLVMTLDLHVRSKRHRETKHGLSIPPRVTPSNMADVALHPRWAFPMLASKRFCFGNLIDVAGRNLFAQSDWLGDQFDASIDPGVIEWVRDQWPGKLVLKGILHPEEARMAVRLGADAIAVSNHGGRQLGDAPSSISALSAIRDAVGDDIELLFDGGVRTGMDVLKALALGADACLIGRAYMYGLAACGEAGVRRSLELISHELDDTMALCGVTDVHDLPADLVTLAGMAAEATPPSELRSRTQGGRAGPAGAGVRRAGG